jgi:RNA polymerase sigma factor (sigma-70 family)
MHEGQARKNIQESLESGAAKILDYSLVLEREDLIRAVVLAKEGCERSWEQVVNGMTRLVFKSAESYYVKWSSHLPAHTSFDDVFAAGLEGLHRAVGKFEPERGLAFTTVAGWWVRNSVQRACYAQIGVGHIPEKTLLKGVSPIDPFVNSLSLDYRDDEGGRAMHESIPSGEYDPDDPERIRAIMQVLASIDKRLPQIAELAQNDCPAKEIGRIVGITDRRVWQLLGDAADAIVRAGLAEYPDHSAARS